MTKIPSFSDVLHSFGFELATVREPRLGQGQLAEAMNKMAAKTRIELESGRDDRKEELEEKLKGVTTAISEQGVVNKVDAATVRAWENGTQFPSETQYKYIKEVLASVAPLSPDEEAKLESAYSSSKAAGKRGNKTEHFGDTLGNILFDRMNSEPPTIANHKEFATYIQMIAPSDALEKLQAEKAALEKAIEANEVIPTPSYFLVDGEGKTQSLQDKDGYLKISGEHIRMIEHGVIPSGELVELMTKTLANARALETNERSDLARKYEQLKTDAKKHFGEQVTTQLLDPAPATAAVKEEVVVTAPAKEVVAEVTPPVKEPVKEVVAAAPQVSVAATPAVQVAKPKEEPATILPAAPVIGGAIVLDGATSNAGQDPALNPPAVTPTYVYQPYVPTHTAANVNSSSVTRLAEAYAKIFSSFGLPAPVDASSPTTRQDNSAGSRAELARRLSLSRKDIPELRPFSLEPLSKEVKIAMSRTGNAVAMAQLAKEYDDAVAEVVADIGNSSQGKKLTTTVSEFESMLASDQEKRKFKEMYKYNNITEVPQASAEDYFRRGGLGMPDAPAIDAALAEVNNQWFKDSGSRRHNVMRHKGDQTAWREPVRNYIKAHDAVRALRAQFEQRFEHHVGLMEEQRTHEVAQRGMANELAELRITHDFARAQRDPDLALKQDQVRRMAELAELEATDPGFARLVVEATHTKQNLPASGKYTKDEKTRDEAAAAAGNNRQ